MQPPKSPVPRSQMGMCICRCADELDDLYNDALFADLYAVDGQPRLSLWWLALMSLMQFSENLSDRQAAEAVNKRGLSKYFSFSA